jgi:hypothetical protein
MLRRRSSLKEQQTATPNRLLVQSNPAEQCAKEPGI